MELKKLKNIIEALLIVSEEGLTLEDIQKVVEEAAPKEISEAADVLKEEYSSDSRAFMIAEIAGRIRIATKPEYVKWVSDLYKIEPDRLSSPSLETLAIIAYKQPATRAEIESIRGVSCGGVIKTLLDKELVLIKGRKDVLGKPLIYSTTEKFLKLFGLNDLNDLPQLREFSKEDLDYSKPDETQVVENTNQEREENEE